MMRVFKTDPITKTIKKKNKIQVDSWIELTNSTTDEITKVVKSTNIDADLITKCLILKNYQV